MFKNQYIDYYNPSYVMHSCYWVITGLNFNYKIYNCVWYDCTTTLQHLRSTNSVCSKLTNYEEYECYKNIFFSYKIHKNKFLFKSTGRHTIKFPLVKWTIVSVKLCLNSHCRCCWLCIINSLLIDIINHRILYEIPDTLTSFQCSPYSSWANFIWNPFSYYIYIVLYRN